MLHALHRLENVHEVQLHHSIASTHLPMSFGQGVRLLDTITVPLPGVG
jgi:hypothetical protein